MEGTETRPLIITSIDLHSEKASWFSDPPQKCPVCEGWHMPSDQCGKG
jgi:hypothetical protein